MSFLLGFLVQEPAKIKYSRIQQEKDFYKIKGDCTDGWGIGFYQNGVAYMVKRASSFYDDFRISTIMDKVKSKSVITHLRKATIGEIKESNTQPFRYGYWLFAHSGTVAHFRKIKSLISQKLPSSFKNKINGNTDSEYCFYLYLYYLKGKGRVKKGDIAFENAINALQLTSRSIDKWTNEIKSQQFSTYNFLVTNGKYMLASRRGDALFYLKKRWSESDNLFKLGNLNITIKEDVGNFVIISSEKIGDDKNWNEIKDNHLLAIDENINTTIYPLFE